MYTQKMFINITLPKNWYVCCWRTSIYSYNSNRNVSSTQSHYEMDLMIPFQRNKNENENAKDYSSIENVFEYASMIELFGRKPTNIYFSREFMILFLSLSISFSIFVGLIVVVAVAIKTSFQKHYFNPLFCTHFYINFSICTLSNSACLRIYSTRIFATVQQKYKHSFPYRFLLCVHAFLIYVYWEWFVNVW